MWFECCSCFYSYFFYKWRFTRRGSRGDNTKVLLKRARKKSGVIYNNVLMYESSMSGALGTFRQPP